MMRSIVLLKDNYKSSTYIKYISGSLMDKSNTYKDQIIPLEDTLEYQGSFISFHRRKFLTKSKAVRTYEYVERNNHQAAVVIIGEKDEKILLIKQYRVPVLCDVIEFPAGLIEKEDISEAAKRELLEETGYRCDIKDISKATLTSAGLTTEMIYFVSAEILDFAGENREDSEQIITLWINKDDWQELKKSDILINGWVYTYCEAYFNKKVRENRL